MKLFRILSLMLSMAFFFGTVVPSHAQASLIKTYDMESSERISTAFDKFNYAMNVEWDQKDPAFRIHAENQLAKSLKGVDAETLQMFTASAMSDAKTREDFARLVTAMKAQNLSQSEAIDAVQKWAEKGSVGLSFAGNGGYHCGRVCKVVTIIIVIIVIKHIFHHDHDNDRPVVVEEEPEYEYPHYPEYPQYSLE